MMQTVDQSWKAASRRFKLAPTSITRTLTGLI